MDLQSILTTIQPFVAMFVALLAAFLTAVWVAAVIWAFRDIRARTRDIFAQILATLMVLIFFPLFPVPGLVLYAILRPRETLAEAYERTLEEEALLHGIEERLACPNCNRSIQPDYLFCPTCQTRLKKACTACGRLLHLQWSICPYCGAGQTTLQRPLEPVPVAVLPSEKAVPQLETVPLFHLSEPGAGWIGADAVVEPAAEVESGPAVEFESEAEPEPIAEAEPRAEFEPGIEVEPDPEPGLAPQEDTATEEDTDSVGRAPKTVKRARTRKEPLSPRL